MIRIGVIKLGNIGSAPLIEFLLDERAERQDIDVRVVGAGAKMGEKQAAEATENLLSFKPQLAIFTTPNASLAAPKKVIESLASSGIPSIVVSDAPAKKATKEIEERGVGYLIVEGDAMIGARREFLDPVEMAIFNSDIIKVLSITGAFNVIRDEIDGVIEALKAGRAPALPRLVIDTETSIAYSGLLNPYAKAKAMAAYEIAKKVADLNVRGCFAIKEMDRYVLTVASAHEMLGKAAQLAAEAREVEKSSDTLQRTPHYDDGKRLIKKRLLEKPE
ncbi:MAG: F420-dependent methylenetetrahydromethanopterin dehydrogenase [Candidatus Bathyarchaeia archaeon]